MKTRERRGGGSKHFEEFQGKEHPAVARHHGQMLTVQPHAPAQWVGGTRDENNGGFKPMNRFNTPGPTFVPSLHLPCILRRATLLPPFISPRIRPRFLSRRSTAYQCPSFFIRASISPLLPPPCFHAVLLCRSFLRNLFELGESNKKSWSPADRSYVYAFDSVRMCGEES